MERIASVKIELVGTRWVYLDTEDQSYYFVGDDEVTEYHFEWEEDALQGAYNYDRC